MRITGVKTFETGAGPRLSALVQPESTSEPMTLYFQFSRMDAPVPASVEPFVLALMNIAMFEKEPIHYEGDLDPVVTEGIAGAQDVLTNWYDFLGTVPVSSAGPGSTKKALPGKTLPKGRKEAVACCFSGGVDSWYSLIKNRDRVTHLLLVRGFDIDLENQRLWDKTVLHAEQVAEVLGLTLITCETNLRTIVDPRHRTWGTPFGEDFWGRCLHGAALSAVAHAASGSVGTLIIPATHNIDQLKPWGSSPSLDPLWSGERLQIVHDGCETDRVGKLQEISKHAVALLNLRVCHNNTADLNCCRCEKCVRTMIGLKLCGALHRSPTFPDHRALAKLHRLEVPHHLHHHYRSLLAMAKTVGNRQIENVLEVILEQRFSVERTFAKGIRAIRRPRALSGRPNASAAARIVAGPSDTASARRAD